MRLCHVTIQTPRFEEELRFYEEIAGLRLIRDMRPNGQDILFFADAAGDTCVEIIRQPDAAAVETPNLSIGFETADAEALREDLQNKGFAPTPMISPHPRVRFFFIRDPAGVTVQFIEDGFPYGE